jgi:dihydropteroate synthase
LSSLVQALSITAWKLGDRLLDFADRVQIMGILNVTPDSFFDGGRHARVDSAVARALQMEGEGADIIDIGGESTRPPLYGGGVPVPLEQELLRVVPVIEALRRRSAIPISVDSTKSEVVRHGLQAGADVVNDTSALRDDEQMSEVVSAAEAPVILMHRRGVPATMQRHTDYQDIMGEIANFLDERVAFAESAGIRRDRIALDPGIGFGKNIAGNLDLIRRLPELARLRCPLVMGASRKSFIWRTLQVTMEESLEGSLTVAVLSVLQGARLLRVHDVEATVRAVRMAEAILPGMRVAPEMSVHVSGRVGFPDAEFTDGEVCKC